MDDEFYEIFDSPVQITIPQRLSKEPPRTEIRDEYFINNTRHQAIVPFNGDYTELPKEPRCDAKQYKFELDTFQKLAISSIEQNESILVSAHTSCGKTVVAEYAIASSIKSRQRVVYTSPIKALSNQKFRELQEEFHDVGLMTGDVTINPEASCLVMTTEILRSMLYRGSEVIREVHWIIFDEIHYMRDKERGVVWEETLILIPAHVRMIFLSATIPNACEFAEWITNTHGQVVHVVYTEKRIIPLYHYFYTDQKYLIQDKDKFLISNFNSALKKLPVSENKGYNNRGKGNAKNIVANLIPILLEDLNLPAVIFSFARKDCEKFATKITKNFLDESEQDLVNTIFENAIASLRPEDRNISLIEHMLPLLKRGIGIHHSGLLPIIREIVEILFQESLIKILFATETFSIGLNMPAKTVIFTSVKKFDGECVRLLTSGEYIQMSGRAGRRGLDDKGEVVCLITEEITVKEVKTLFSACTDKLKSAFRLTYNMILNLLRVEGLDPQFILSRSFYHFQAYKNAIEVENTIKTLDYVNSTPLAELLRQRQDLYKKRSISLCETYLTMLNGKRVIDIIIPETMGIIKQAIISVREEINQKDLSIKHNKQENIKKGNKNNNLYEIEQPYKIMKPNPRKSDFERLRYVITVYVLINDEIETRKFPIDAIANVYSAEVKPKVSNFTKTYTKLPYKDEINEQILQLEEQIRLIIPEINLENCIFCKKSGIECIQNCTFKESGNEEFDAAVERLKFINEDQEMQKKLMELKKLKEIYHMDECGRMIQVLKTLEHIDDTSVLIKGKMASEISASDELILTEMIFNSEFPRLPLIDMVALLSCMVCEEKASDSILSEENDNLYSILAESCEKVYNVMKKCGINVNPEEYLNKFSPELMDVVKMWMSGRTFSEICNNTNAFEGSIIRTFKRLEELLRQLTSAAGVIGNNELMDLFGQGIFSIKRDIIFANSLYI